jgi:hypothetical protein
MRWIDILLGSWLHKTADLRQRLRVACSGLTPIQLVHWLEELEHWRAFLLIFAVGVTWRMLISLARGTYTDLLRYEMERAALSLAHTGRLADPYLIPTGYTAHVAPGYALLLAAIFRIFGTGYIAEIVKELVSSSAAAAQYAFLPLIAPALGIGRRAGIAAALFGAFYPVKFAAEVVGDWEASFAGLALVLLIWAVAATWRTRNFTASRGAWQGLGWGAALLISPSLLPILIVTVALGFFLLGRRRPGQYLAYAAAMSLMTALCLAPWAWRNQRVLGAPVFTRSNFGLELWLSNNDLAGPLEPENDSSRLYHALHPSENLREAEAVRRMGEVAYNRDRLRLGLRWIRAHPRRFAILTAERFLYTWFPRTGRPRDAVLWCLTITSALGLTALWRSQRIFALLLASCLCAYTGAYYLIQVDVRYRYPIDWIVLITAAHFLAVAAAYVTARLRIEQTRATIV